MIEVFGAVGTKVVIDRQEYVLMRLHQREMRDRLVITSPPPG